jgi:hypothetical protein
LYNSILVLHLHPQYNTSIAVLLKIDNAKIAQLVERDLAKVEVAGSSPVFRSLPYEIILISKCSDGEIGRHAGLKIQ